MSKEELTKKVTISMTDEEQNMAREDSKKIFGGKDGNISGYVRLLIRKANKNKD